VVKIGERVILELLVDVLADVERVALVLAHAQDVALALGLIGRKIDPMHRVAGVRIRSEDAGLALGHDGAGSVEQLPLLGLLGGAVEHGHLVQLGQVPHLVDGNLGRWGGVFRRRRLKCRIGHVQIVDADRDGHGLGERPRQMEGKLRNRIGRAAHDKLALKALRLRAHLEPSDPILAVRRTRHAQLGPNARRRRCPGAEIHRVAMALLDHQRPLHELRVPVVLALVLHRQTQGAVLDVGTAARGRRK
jgi:hypothetical protein